jgi:hypothetical protein
MKMSLGQVASRLARLTDAFLDGALDKDLFEERKTALLEERRRLGEAAAQLDTDPGREITRSEEFLELCGSAEMLYESAIGEEKRDLVASITSNRWVEGKKLDFTWASPFDLIAERNAITSSRLQRDEPRTWRRLLADLVEWFHNHPGAAFLPKTNKVEGEDKDSEVAA